MYSGDETSYLEKIVFNIEEKLKSFGYIIYVTEINKHSNYYELRAEIGHKTKISDIIELEKDIALAAESSTGKVEIIAPLPGTGLISINVPIKKKHKNEPYN